LSEARSRKQLVSKAFRASLLCYQVIVKLRSDPIWAALALLVLFFEILDGLSLIGKKLKSRILKMCQ